MEENIEYLKKLTKPPLREEWDFAYKLDKTTAQALENLIKGYRELEEENIQLKKHIHIKKCQNCGKKFECKRSDAKYCKECGKKINNSNYYENLTEEQKAKRREKARLSMQKIRESRKLEEK